MSENPASVPVPLLDLKAQYATIRHEIRPVLDEVCDAQGFILGPRVEAFEKAVAAYVGTKHAIGTTTATTRVMRLAIQNGNVRYRKLLPEV